MGHAKETLYLCWFQLYFVHDNWDYPGHRCRHHHHLRIVAVVVVFIIPTDPAMHVRPAQIILYHPALFLCHILSKSSWLTGVLTDLTRPNCIRQPSQICLIICHFNLIFYANISRMILLYLALNLSILISSTLVLLTSCFQPANIYCW